MGDAEIDQTEPAVLGQDHILRLDVAMRDPDPMQRIERPRHPARDGDAFAQADVLARQLLLQRLAGIERHDGVEPAASLRRQFDHLADEGTARAGRDPGLAHEGELTSGLRRHARMWKLERHRRAARLGNRAKQQAVAPLRDRPFQPEPVDHVARLRQRQDRQRGGEFGKFVGVHRRQIDDVDHQSRRIVGAAGGERVAHQCFSRLLRRQPFRHAPREPGDRKLAMHAVAANQKTVVLLQSQRQMLDLDRGLETDRPQQRMRHLAAPIDMVLRQLLAAAPVEPIHPGVADMQDMADAATQREGGKGAGHAGEFGIDAALRMHPVVERLQSPRPRALHPERRRQAAPSVEKTAHRRLRRDPSPLSAADSVRHRRDEPAALLAPAAEILIVRPPAARAGEAAAHPQPPPFGATQARPAR